MRYSNWLRCIACVLPIVGAFGQQTAEPDYSGTWHLESDSSVKLVLEQKGDNIHVKELKGADLKADYTCNTVGKECSVKNDGHPAKESFWFNGPKLVQFETRGNNVVRRRFELEDGGRTLKVELSSIVPAGKAETLAFAREQQ